MNLDYSFFRASDSSSLAYKKWNKVENPKEVIIIVHGMAEHIERYDELASFLNSNNYIVYGLDQRGNGKTLGRRGYFCDKNGHKRVVEDQLEFYNFVKQENEGLDISYIGHSMGSFITRDLLTRDINVKKVILSGARHEYKKNIILGKLMVDTITFFRGKTKEAHFIDNYLNGPFAKSVKDPITKFDWISRDQYEVAQYINDCNCGFICTNQFYKDLVRIVAFASKAKNIRKIDSNLPILLYSGDHDPVSGMGGEYVKNLESLFKSCDLNVRLHLNPGGRHENIKETNKQEVFDYFLNFLDNVN